MTLISEAKHTEHVTRYTLLAYPSKPLSDSNTLYHSKPEYDLAKGSGYRAANILVSHFTHTPKYTMKLSEALHQQENRNTTSRVLGTAAT